MGKEIQTSTGKLWIDEQLGLIRFDYFRGSICTLVEARENLVAAKKLADGKRHPFLCDITKCKLVDREARALFGGQEVKELWTALALLSKTPIGNIIGNFYLRLNANDRLPTRLFTSEREAIAWLKGFIQE